MLYPFYSISAPSHMPVIHQCYQSIRQTKKWMLKFGKMYKGKSLSFGNCFMLEKLLLLLVLLMNLVLIMICAYGTKLIGSSSSRPSCLVRFTYIISEPFAGELASIVEVKKLTFKPEN